MQSSTTEKFACNDCETQRITSWVYISIFVHLVAVFAMDVFASRYVYTTSLWGKFALIVTQL